MKNPINFTRTEDFKVLLINISLRPESEINLFPVGLGYIATAIYNAGFNLKILDIDALRLTDEELEENIKETDFNVAAMGCMVTGYKYVKKYCRMIKKYKKVPIIVGNSVATSIPHILMEKTKADIGVIGEGDITIVELLNAIRENKPLEDIHGIFFKKNGEVIFTSNRELIKNLDELPFIKYDLFDMDVYLKKSNLNVSEPYPIEFEKIKAFPVNTARGCPFACTFCYHVFRGKRYRFRSVENIREEIKLLKEKYRINFIMFWDELSLFSKKRAEDIADMFLAAKLGIFYKTGGRAGLFNENDLELAKRLKKSGCVTLGSALESANEEILKAMNKKITVNEFITQSIVLHKAGIKTPTSLVIGYPQETLESIQKTFDVCYQCDIYPSTGYLLPQPRTPMYDVAIKMGKIKDEEEYLLKMGDRQDFRINLTNIPQEEIESLVVKNLKKISEKLKLGLDKDHLIKTGHYRQKLEN